MGSPPPIGQGQRRIKGVKGAKGSKGSEQGVNREQRGVKGSEGSVSISTLGFRVPTTCGRKNFDDHI